MSSPARIVRLAAAASVVLLATACEHPPVETAQVGYRGLGMVQVNNPKTVEARAAAVVVPESPPAAAPGSPPAKSVFKNVQVLGDLDVAQFTRVMVGITNWVAPDKGCAYCHEGSDLASDGLYTKIVSRRMIEMTRHLNSEWASHVGETGVTCMTCHRGKAVPEGAWTADAGPATAKGAAGNRRGQNVAAPAVGLSSLPYDPFTPLLTEKNPHLRVASTTALPTGTPGSIAHTEQTYALMMNMSQSLGVNCTYCHNSQSFGNWASSSPQRVTAYHGLQMVRDLNKDYLIPLKSALPAERLGPQGDAPKVACVTCHAGQAKPLNGASLLKEFPELRGKTKAVAQAAAPAK